MRVILVLLVVGVGNLCAQVNETEALQQQIELQQKQIDRLQAALNEQKQLLTRLISARGGHPSDVLPAAAVPPDPRSEAGAVSGAAGFRFSGDFRFRADMQLRSGNETAGPLQNIRSRYRVRLNVDRQLDPQFKFHLQLSTGPYNVAITNDQDMAGMVSKHPFSIAEAYVDYQPSKNFAIRGGRMEEVFADNMRFLWDDDVRFNGFQQTLQIPLGSNHLGLKSLEIRGAEYLLGNPNVAVLSAESPFAGAGFAVGAKVRAGNLFHAGVIAKGSLGERWTQQFTTDAHLYRNPNQIQLASTANGVVVLVNGALGITLSGPLTGTGNATTAPGGAIYNAPNFQVVRLAYRLEDTAFAVGGHKVPIWVDFQASRNIGTSKLRDAFAVSANLGQVKKPGDARLLYQYVLKDANSLISQFTDDDLGTGSGVNIAVHAFRFDVGLKRFLQWQNLLFVQSPRRSSNPREQLFVPLQRGANTTYRYLGQLAFTF